MLHVACPFFLLFSSRRRHTRCLSDWSSDVCSSDLLYSCCRRARVLRSPTPSVGTPPRWRVSPWPLSLISIQSSSKTWRVEMRIHPGARRGPMPWRMAFSTSGCRIRFGTNADRAYNAAKTLHMTYADLPHELVDLVILVDDGSSDETAQIARDMGLELFVHNRNYGYGANQKTCYREALKAGAD